MVKAAAEAAEGEVATTAEMQTMTMIYKAI